MKRFYFAPLEGITTYIYRNLHHQWFGGMDKYFTPFVSPTSNRDFMSRAKKDVLPEHNRDIPVVPQILSNRADEFLYTADQSEPWLPVGDGGCKGKRLGISLRFGWS